MTDTDTTKKKGDHSPWGKRNWDGSYLSLAQEGLGLTLFNYSIIFKKIRYLHFLLGFQIVLGQFESLSTFPWFYSIAHVACGYILQFLAEHTQKLNKKTLVANRL